MREPDATEIRVLGSLLEKQRTTPDSYPLTLNSLRLACNQATNRDPVLQLEEAEIRDALARLSGRRWTRAASGAGSRAAKYRQTFAEALALSSAEIAVLALLMLRGPQTAGELKGRSERLHRFADLAGVAETLEALAARGLAEPLPRRPGEKGRRWRQTVGASESGAAVRDRPGPGEDEAAVPPSGDGRERRADGREHPVDGPPRGTDLAERLARVEGELGALREEVRTLRETLGGRV